MNTHIQPVITGKFKDTIRYKDGRVEVIEGQNLIVDGIFKLITSLLSNKGGYSGLQYWAVGEGLSSWNSSQPPEPAVTDVQLTKEIGRKQINSTDVTWVDSEGRNSVTPTNKLKVKVTFGYNDCAGTWREFGLFGGNASTTTNSGMMINHKNHGVIVKTTEMEIEREIIFTFTKGE